MKPLRNSVAHLAAVTLAASLLVSSAAVGNQAARVHRDVQDGIEQVTVQPAGNGAGWQTYYNLALTPGTNLIFTDSCPEIAPTPVNGSFSPNPAAKVGLSVVASYRPATKQRNSWVWAINWPSGAPAGAHIIFNVYCVQ